jgi:hypothetical protein
MKYNAYPKKVRKRDIDAEERPFKLDLKIVHYALVYYRLYITYTLSSFL